MKYWKRGTHLIQLFTPFVFRPHCWWYHFCQVRTTRTDDISAANLFRCAIPMFSSAVSRSGNMRIGTASKSRAQKSAYTHASHFSVPCSRKRSVYFLSVPIRFDPFEALAGSRRRSRTSGLSTSVDTERHWNRDYRNTTAPATEFANVWRVRM
jgi:hypothetical protein